MTQNAERAPAELTEPPLATVPQRNAATSPDGSGSWWHQRYLWLVLLCGVVGFNLIYALPRYLSFDESQSRIALDPARTDQHFGLLVAHVVTGNVAMVTVLLQLWPWLRRNHPQVHRMSGRIYIFAGVLPAAGLGLLALIPLRQDQTGSIGLGVEGALWLVTTGVGWRMARQHRYAQHQRWMLYSFALALGSTYGRIIAEVLTHYPSTMKYLSMDTIVEISYWLGWIVNVLIAHLWFEHQAKRSSKAGGQIVTYPSPVH